MLTTTFLVRNEIRNERGRDRGTMNRKKCVEWSATDDFDDNVRQNEMAHGECENRSCEENAPRISFHFCYLQFIPILVNFIHKIFRSACTTLLESNICSSVHTHIVWMVQVLVVDFGGKIPKMTCDDRQYRISRFHKTSSNNVYWERERWWEGERERE